MKGAHVSWLLVLLLLCLNRIPPAHAADAVADFYRGKNIFLQIGAGVGASYDATGRLVARYMGKYIPGNPNIVVENMPSLQLTNQFGNTTPRDGTYFGLSNDSMPTTPFIDAKSAHYDARKFFFLGSTIRQNQWLAVWHTARAKTIDDLFSKETIVGVTAAGTTGYDYVRVANAVLGTKFKIIPGYQGVGDTKLAMERGEVEATVVNRVNVKTDFAEALSKKDVTLIAAFGMKPPGFGDAPLMPLGKTVEDRQLFELTYARQDFGTPFFTPPDVPVDRAMALRHAFETTLQDAGFLAEAQRLRVDIEPVSGDELAQLTARLYDTPPVVISHMLSILSSDTK